jgi:DNA-binding transcriptional LysR family regulator
VPISPDRVTHTVSQVLTMLWLVAGGRGVAFVPASASRLHIDGVGFARLRTAVREPVELHLLWTKESKNPALWRALTVLEDGSRVE